MEKMRAIVCTKYGPPEVLQMEEVDQPIPKNHEVLIKVRATTAHIGDTKIRRLEPGLGPVIDIFFKPIMRLMLGINGPRHHILGMDLAGEIVEIGKNVTKFKIGDKIIASTFKGFKFGAYAEFKCMPEDGLIALKPNNMTYLEAAPISNGALTAWVILRKANIRKGQKVLIYGASGSMGTYSVQLAKYFGAEVTGVSSTKHLEMVKSLGADKVLDYTRDSIEKDYDYYDVIFDTVSKMPRSQRKKSLKKSGSYLNGLSSSNGIKLKPEDLLFLIKLCEAGKIITVIDRQYSLEEMVEAHRYVDQGHKKGHVTIKI